MTAPEIDRTKGELVRALRRRAAELEAREHELHLACAGPGARPSARRVREPKERTAHQAAFFARHTFRSTATTPAAGSSAAVG